MNKRLMEAAVAIFSMLSLFAGQSLGAVAIEVGNIELQPHTPGQLVEIRVSGGDQVEGLEFYVCVGNGGPELEALGHIPSGTGLPGPRITRVDLLTDTIFAANNAGQQTEAEYTYLPQVSAAYVQTSSGAVSADGLLARITLDTSEFSTGTFPLSLTVVDSETNFAGIPINITDGTIEIVSPEVDAGPDQQVAAGAMVYLSGSCDAPTADLAYEWRQVGGPAVVLDNWFSPEPAFVAPSRVLNTALEFELTVSDGYFTATDTVVVVVNRNSALFSIDAGPDQKVANGAQVQLQATTTVPDDRSVEVSWVQVGGPKVTATEGDPGQISFTAPVGVSNTALVFEARAYDGVSTSIDTVTVIVNDSPLLPTADAGQDRWVAAGSTVQLVADGIDPAGYGLSYLWLQIDGTEVQLSSEIVGDPVFIAPTASKPDRLEFELRASSGPFTSVDTVIINVAAEGVDPNAMEPDPTEDAEYQLPTPTQQPVNDWLNWSSGAGGLAGIVLLIIGLLLLFLFML